MESLEQVAKITLTARLLGNVNVLNEEKQSKLFSIRDKMGLRDYNLACTACNVCTSLDGQEKSPSPTPNPTSMSKEELVKQIVLKVCDELNVKLGN